MLEADYIGAEWRLPPVHRTFEPSFFVPIFGYFVLFEGIAYCVRCTVWVNHSPFERYRLHNVSVSLVHSAITGGCALMFMLLKPRVMFYDTMHWYEPWAAQLPLLSMGYFIHDAVDILSNERSRFACEILLHHAAVFSIFSVGMLSHKFLPYAYWALLVEVSSVFIHMRTILEISGLHMAQHLLYRVTRILSIATVVVFRFGVLSWMLRYIVVNRRHFHAFYTYAGILADVFFLVISLVLFMRMLTQDGFFGERSRRKALLKRTSDAAQKARNVTFLLNSILKNYDKNFRPNFDDGQPTMVYIDVFVRTVGPISEMTDTYAFDCYFRQTWSDERLRFNSDYRKTLSLGMSTLDKIWKPDTYFWNGQGSWIHKLTTPNRLVRLSAEGEVLYSSRLTVKAKCQMDLHRFPLDIQACRLIIGSFAYGADEMLFRWKTVDNTRGVHMDYEAIRDLPQFELRRFQLINNSLRLRDVNYSALEVRFYLHRHFGYFLINFYVPCTLIVLLSWVALWINREATSDRIGLGITSVLTMTFLALDSRSDSPRVNFPTALDIYILICFVSLLLCICEFTVVHYFTKFNTADPELQRAEKERIRRMLKRVPREAMLRVTIPKPQQRSSLRSNAVLSRADGGRYSVYGQRQKDPQKRCYLSPQLSRFEHLRTPLDVHSFQADSLGWRLYYMMLDRGKETDPFDVQMNSISVLDRFSRVLMPIAFASVCLIYYEFYVNTPYHFVFDDTDP